MRRYKIVTCILLILSLFGFVLAAPVTTQEVREACADAVDGEENVVIRVGPGKRADIQEEEDLFARAQQGPSSSSLAPNYASGTPPDPSSSSGESKPPLLSASGEIELSWNPEPEGGANSVQPASSSKAKSVSWAPKKMVLLPSGQIYTQMLAPPKSSPLPPPPVPEGHQPDQPASSSKAKSVSWAPKKTVLLPSGRIYTQMLAPPESSPLPPPPVPEGHQPNQPASLPLTKEVHLPSSHVYSEVLPPEMAAHESPLPTESESILSKLVGNLKFWRRISVTAGDVVTEGEGDSQGTVDT